MTAMFADPRPEESDSREAPTSSFRWATVTQASPLRVRLDGDTLALPITPDTLVAGLAINNRVWCQIYGRRLILLGKAQGA